jgi:hypothetical protein
MHVTSNPFFWFPHPIPSRLLHALVLKPFGFESHQSREPLARLIDRGMSGFVACFLSAVTKSIDDTKPDPSNSFADHDSCKHESCAATFSHADAALSALVESSSRTNFREIHNAEPGPEMQESELATTKREKKETSTEIWKRISQQREARLAKLVKTAAKESVKHVSRWRCSVHVPRWRCSVHVPRWRCSVQTKRDATWNMWRWNDFACMWTDMGAEHVLPFLLFACACHVWLFARAGKDGVNDHQSWPCSKCDFKPGSFQESDLVFQRNLILKSHFAFQVAN